MHTNSHFKKVIKLERFIVVHKAAIIFTVIAKHHNNRYGNFMDRYNMDSSICIEMAQDIVIIFFSDSWERL